MQINRNLTVKFVFILPNRFFDQTDVTFEFFSKGASASLLSVLSHFYQLWCFQALELFKASSFTIVRLIPVYLAIFLDNNAYGAAFPLRKLIFLSNLCLHL